MVDSNDKDKLTEASIITSNQPNEDNYDTDFDNEDEFLMIFFVATKLIS